MTDLNLIMDALVDTGKLLPLLAAIYFLVGFLEYRFGHRMENFVARFYTIGPVVGAILGCLPQCGFSVVAATLYVKRLISVGTVLAVFISTSDEAVPVLLSMPEKAGMVGALILLKVIIAVTFGMGVDLFLNRRKLKKHFVHDKDCVIDEHCGCCSHNLSDRPRRLQALFLHPLKHTIKIFIFLFLLSVTLNFVIQAVGEERIGVALLNGTIFQPFLAALIGLIPNCFASVLLAEFYAKGAISFGAMVAGLCAGAGLGLLVLFKENKNFKDTFTVIGLLLIISIISGILIQWVGVFSR
jgi:hypothetical protein